MFLGILLLIPISINAQFQNILKQVYYLKDPINRLIFDFEFKPKYDIKAQENKLTVILYDLTIKETSWLENLPKDIIKRI